MIVAPDGTPVTAQPATDAPEATMADLNLLLEQMSAMHDRLGPVNPRSQQILSAAAWWLTMLATKVVELDAKVRQAPPPPVGGPTLADRVTGWADHGNTRCDHCAMLRASSNPFCIGHGEIQ